MRLLFSHTNYPAQFRRLVPALQEAGHELVFLCSQKEWHAPPANNLRLLAYHPHRESKLEFLHPYLRRFEEVVLQGQAAFRSASRLKAEGWIPDVIVSHIGFGSGLYLSDCFPGSRRIGCVEWYYRPFGSDVDFLRNGDVEDDRKMRLRTWNAQLLLEAESCESLVTPTHWQWSQFPRELQARMKIVHEGIDWNLLSALSVQRPNFLQSLPRNNDIEWVTYVSRGFEEYRGFPQAMKAIEILQKKRPSVHVAIAGADVVAYGSTREDGRSWQQWAQQDLELDPLRTHWLGSLQVAEYQSLLAYSKAHLYLTVPFVLSWSLLEAMAVGCPIVASATPPVQEVLKDGENAFLVDFWDPQAQADALERFLANPDFSRAMGKKASDDAKKFAFETSLKSWKNLLSWT